MNYAQINKFITKRPATPHPTLAMAAVVCSSLAPTRLFFHTHGVAPSRKAHKTAPRRHLLAETDPQRVRYATVKCHYDPNPSGSVCMVLVGQRGFRMFRKLCTNVGSCFLHKK